LLSQREGDPQTIGNCELAAFWQNEDKLMNIPDNVLGLRVAPSRFLSEFFSRP